MVRRSDDEVFVRYICWGCSLSKDTEDSKLRMRLAEALSSAGVHSSRVAVEVLYMLPAEFVRGYTDLFHRALSDGQDGKGESDARKAELGKAAGKRTAEGVAGARRQKGSRGIWVVSDERAMGEKQRIDRHLRKLAREMKKGDGAGGPAVFKCEEVRMGKGGEGHDVLVRKGCGRWVESEWKYCPNCGRKQG